MPVHIIYNMGNVAQGSWHKLKLSAILASRPCLSAIFSVVHKHKLLIYNMKYLLMGMLCGTTKGK